MNIYGNRKIFRLIGTAVALSLWVPVLQAASDDVEREFSVQPGGIFILNSDGGSVAVRTGSDNQVRVHIRNPDNMEITFEQNGNDIKVNAELEGRRNRIRTAFSIEVPEQFNLDLRTLGGSIDIPDRRGDVLVWTAGGSVEIGDVVGLVDTQTAGGNISIGMVTSNVRAQSAGGSITIGNVGSNVEADTAGGSITVGDVDGDAELDTAGGNITAGFVAGTADMDTAGGSIRLEGSGTRITAATAGGSITANRSSGPVDARTAGGNIILGRIDAAIDARTAGGSIEAELGNVPDGEDSSIRLVTSGGDIEIRLPGDHRASVDARIEVSRRYRGDYRIYTDFPLTIQGEDGRDITARGDINGGGDAIRLETNNGDIRILRGD